MLNTRYTCQNLIKQRFYREIYKNIQISDLIKKIRHVGTELLNADGRTDG
jgi:hypothetical protein